jgi:hypothetical protein
VLCGRTAALSAHHHAWNPTSFFFASSSSSRVSLAGTLVCQESENSAFLLPYSMTKELLSLPSSFIHIPCSGDRVYLLYIVLYCCVCVCVYCIPNPGIHSWYYLTECFCVCFSSFSSICTIFIASSYYYSSPTFIHPLSPTTQTHLIKNIYACQDAAPSPGRDKKEKKKVFRFLRRA